MLAAPDAPSLWPLLEQRMGVHDALIRSPWMRALHRVTDRGLRALTDLDGERPLRSAWMRDSLGEMLEGVGLSSPEIHAYNGPNGSPDRRPRAVARSSQSPVWVMGAGIAAAILALVIGLPAARRRHVEAQSIIRANSEPIAGLISSAAPVEAEEPAPPELVEDRDISSRELAQADPIPVPQAPASGREGSPASKASAPSRFNFDLEHGIPMPPDAREAKPMY